MITADDRLDNIEETIIDNLVWQCRNLILLHRAGHDPILKRKRYGFLISATAAADVSTCVRRSIRCLTVLMITKVMYLN